MEERLDAERGGDGEVEGVREPAQGQVHPRVRGLQYLPRASHALGAEDDGELLGDDGGGRIVRVAESGVPERVVGHADRFLGQVRGPDDVAGLSQGFDARARGGKLADGGELVRSSREQLVSLPPRRSVAVRLEQPSGPLAGAVNISTVVITTVVVVVHEPVVDALVAHLHRIDQPDVLNPQRLARAYDGAVVVLVGAPLDDAEDAGGPRAYRGLRLA
mmetsp:Transcript_7262/g.32039  ORF Transcript_7262/g.32039 Transcript_7262/m.32039 type:complete len:218 (+) Transcript_7262:544-1197(+)